MAQYQIFAPFFDYGVPSDVNTSRAVVFKNCENVAYLAFWITQELALPAKITIMCDVHDVNLFELAFPGHQMGRNAVLIEFDSDEGFNFMKAHMATMKTAAAVIERNAANN